MSKGVMQPGAPYSYPSVPSPYPNTWNNKGPLLSPWPNHREPNYQGSHTTKDFVKYLEYAKSACLATPRCDAVVLDRLYHDGKNYGNILEPLTNNMGPWRLASGDFVEGGQSLGQMHEDTGGWTEAGLTKEGPLFEAKTISNHVWYVRPSVRPPVRPSVRSACPSVRSSAAL